LLKDECYFNIATANQLVFSKTDEMISVCDLIGEQEIKKECYLAISDLISSLKFSTSKKICMDKLGSYLDECYLNLVSEPFKENVVFSVANYDLAKGLCEDISDITLKENCYFALSSAVAKQRTNTAISLCSNALDSDLCEIGVAQSISASDYDLAEDICNSLGPGYVEDCLLEIADEVVVLSGRYNKALSLCESYSDSDLCYFVLMDDMYQDSSKYRSNHLANVDFDLAIDVCSRIEDLELNKKCVGYVAKSIASSRFEKAIELCDTL
jgi:hypothetical protein